MLYRVLGAPGRTRTCSRQIRRLLLYPLSYWGPESPERDLLTGDSTHVGRIMLCALPYVGNRLGR